MTEKCKTVRKTVTIRSDVYQKLCAMFRNPKFDGFYLLRDSTLITLILEWAFEHGVNEKELLELYADSYNKYGRFPMRPTFGGKSPKELRDLVLKKAHVNEPK